MNLPFIDFNVALIRAYAWAVLGNADEFFAEFTPHAHSTSLPCARELTDEPILSQFPDGPGYGALIRALQSP